MAIFTHMVVGTNDVERAHIAPTAYAAYVRDPDGNKICTYCYLPA